MSEMVEQVARAIWRHENPPHDGFSQAAPNDWDLWPDNGRSASLAHVDRSRDDYRNIARAAIAAIREPIPHSMFLAAERAGVSFQTQERVWPKMIDAAMGEGEPGQ